MNESSERMVLLLSLCVRVLRHPLGKSRGISLVCPPEYLKDKSTFEKDIYVMSNNMSYTVILRVIVPRDLPRTVYVSLLNLVHQRMRIY